MTDHELKAKFEVKAAAALGRLAPGGLAPVSISLLEHVPAVAEVIRGLGQQPCQDAAHLRALEILTALQVVADAQTARMRQDYELITAARTRVEQRAAARAEEGAKHQGELVSGDGVALQSIAHPNWPDASLDPNSLEVVEFDDATATMIEVDEIERIQAQAKMYENLDALKTVPLGTEDDS